GIAAGEGPGHGFRGGEGGHGGRVAGEGRGGRGKWAGNSGGGGGGSGGLTIRPMQPIYYQIILQTRWAIGSTRGVIYAVVQFREARKTQHVANFAKLVELQMQLRKMRVDDPSLAYVYKDDVAELHDDDEIRAYFMNLMQLSIFEIVWFSHKHGQLP